ncbi:unnamed protein product [Symbiodinium sp. CCMP2592]|nr:unnamed protein product [Symbiodinium sp. CCMP2592]
MHFRRTPVTTEHALQVMCPAQGGAGLRPVLARREYRLPLLVKYHKPKGMVTSMRVQKNIKKTDLEDLRSVVSFAGDEFELDLYHPVGGLATGASGLFLWSRSGRLTRQLQDPRRGVANILELEVCGAVRAEYLDEALQTGVNLGVTGFQRTYTASVLEAALLPDSSLQEPRSRVTILARDGRAQVPAMVERCSPEADAGAHLGDALAHAFRKNHCRLAAYLLVILRPSFSDDAVRVSQILEAVMSSRCGFVCLAAWLLSGPLSFCAVAIPFLLHPTLICIRRPLVWRHGFISSFPYRRRRHTKGRHWPADALTSIAQRVLVYKSVPS